MKLDGATRSVLIHVVDNDAAFRLMMRTVLEESDFDVIESKDGFEAISTFKEYRPDLVILDVMMPVMDGFETCKQLRALPEGQNTPIIMMTGLSDLKTIESSFDLGATEFITKPISWSLVPHRVNFTLKASRALMNLQRLDKMKSDFISIAAHEMLTPVTTIMGYAEALINPEVYGHPDLNQRKEFLAEIYEKGEILSRLVDDLLDLSYAEKGLFVKVEKTPCEPVGVLESAVKQFRLNHATYTFELTTEPLVGKTCLLDKRRIVQALENILNNAVKYSPGEESISVTGRMLKDSYQISVSDRGPGMTQDHLEKIFDNFYRADMADSSIGGLGIGLGIVKQIINAHDGEISVESFPGQGTTVFFDLPVVSVL